MEKGDISCGKKNQMSELPLVYVYITLERSTVLLIVINRTTHYFYGPFAIAMSIIYQRGLIFDGRIW